MRCQNVWSAVYSDTPVRATLQPLSKHRKVKEMCNGIKQKGGERCPWLIGKVHTEKEKTGRCRDLFMMLRPVFVRATKESKIDIYIMASFKTFIAS